MTAPLLAIAAEEQQEKPKLFSKGYKLRVPIDEVAPEHTVIHHLLVRWGLWLRKSYSSTTLASIESLYSKSGTPPATAPLAADPRLAAIELAVVRIPLAQHRRLLIMMYIFRCSGFRICGALKLPYEAYPAETYRARTMVVERVPGAYLHPALG